MRVIINGDDFGKSQDINHSIEFCHQNGILTSATLIATGEAFENAVQISRRNPALGIGVHLAINDEFEPIFKQPSSTLNPLTNRFYPLGMAINNAKKFKYRRADLIKEYCLQIEKVLDSGLSITHLDHHHHLHLYLPVLEAMIEVAKKFKIPYIRSQYLLLHKNRTLYKMIYRRIHQLYLKARLATTDGYMEFVDKEPSDIYNRLVSLLNTNYGIVELMMHPSSENNNEVLFLTDKNVIQLMKSHNLVSYRNIQN